MVNRRSRLLGGLAAAAAALLAMTGCSAGGAGGDAAQDGPSLVIDRAFDLKTADPARSYEHTGNMLAHALYDTLLTFEGSDVTQPVPSLAEVTPNADNTEFEVTLTGERHFSSGNPITADDVVFSLERVQGIAGSPSFLLDGVKVEKVDDKSVKLTTEKPMPQLPFILPNPSLGIVERAVVEQNGGSSGSDDAAEEFLNTTSAGSGPYLLESLELTSQIVLVANPAYDGPKEPGYGRIVIRNVETATQLVNVKGGDSQLALDLTGDQVAGLGSDIAVTTAPSSNLIFLLLNQSPEVNRFTSNPDFLAAVKSAIDYEALLEVAGEGSVVAPGLIPSSFVGALGEGQGPKHDPAKAAESLAKSGYAGETIQLNYPNDITLNGVDFNSVAQRVQSQLKEAGINVELAPAPVATELDAYRGGKETIGLWYWGADYPDPADYQVFTPGDLVGLRANWADGANPAVEQAAQAAATATGDARQGAYEELQNQLNAVGPFIPLLQPAVNIAAASSVTGVAVNDVWGIDLADLKPAG